MQRSRDSDGHQDGSNKQKKVKIGTTLPFVHLSEDDSRTGSTDFATSIHSSHNSKGDISETNEQLESKSGRPVGRLHISDSKKRGAEDMNGQIDDRPAKRSNHGYNIIPTADNDHMSDEPVMPNSRKKRNLAQMREGDDLDSELPSKRMNHGYNVIPTTASDDPISDEPVMPNSRKKRNLDQMIDGNGLGSDRLPKRSNHGCNTMPTATNDELMSDEPTMYSPPHGRRNTESEESKNSVSSNPRLSSTFGR
ncbi:hypothetical protein FAGAP_964 [Fusarium agapanthi]|uniref:Uncharacterized protein n=1 Tax=Fusarium agapanthi TaxID=1803897 RepID=A0A9P5EI34_9HYPO|nr:hypothetical protein FAGAP_964 [Fusarium agapanthi]